MATSGIAYLISVAIYAAILIAIVVCFSIWRRLALTRKFFAPKRYVTEEGYLPPPPVSDSFLGWVGDVFRLNEAQIIGAAGIDAALYIKFLRMGWETFLVLSFVVLVIILPINLVNDEVDSLMATQAAGPSPYPFTYWIPPPPPPPPTAPGEEPKEVSPEDFPEAPAFWNETDLPDAPEGTEWKTYENTVPPLPPAPPGIDVWYYSSDSIAKNYEFTDLDKTTLSNIPEGSSMLYAHAVISWVVTFVVFLQLWRYCREALRLRMFYLLNTPRGAESHTVLVTDIPAVRYGTIPDRLDGTLLKMVPQSVKDHAFKQVAALDGAATGALTKTASAVSAPKAGDLTRQASAKAAAEAMSSTATTVDAATGRWEIPDRWTEGITGIKSEGSVKGMVDAEFTKIYHEDFSHSHMAYDTSTLDALVTDYDKTLMASQDLVDDYISRKQRDLEIKPKEMTVVGAKLGAWGREKYGLKPVKVDALQFYQDRLAYLKGEIEAAQGDAKGKVWPSSFVTFNRRVPQVVASGALMCEDLTAWTCQAAPRPDEIVWKNLGLRSWERSNRGTIMGVSFVLLTLFYLIPVTAIQGILSTNSFFSFLQDIPFVNSLLTAILPGLILAIFIALLPPIIKAMNRWEGMISLSQIDLSLMSKFFGFQVVTVFLGSFIAGSAFNQLNQLINDPGSIVTLLGTAAPQTAIFFLTYITLRGLLTVPLSILRIVPFVVFWAKTKFLAGTERAKARLWQNQMFSYGTVVPGDTMVVLLGVTFCIICPIIAPAALIYFTTSYIIHKHNLVYVFRQPYQSGAMAWPRIFRQCITSLIVFQLVMICLLALKESIGGPLIVLPLPFLTLIFGRAAANTFWRPMQSLSLMAAADLDAKEGAAGAVAAVPKEGGRDPSDLYLSPSFTLDTTAHATAVEDCKRMAAVLAGGSDDALFARDAVDDADFDVEVDHTAALAAATTTEPATEAVGAVNNV